MRLIRLTSEDRNGLFDNQFNTDIQVTQGQQIALQSSSFNEQINEIEIDNSNNNLTFSYKADTTLAVQLEETEYNDANVEDLYTDITNKLNAAVDFGSGKTIGISFRAQNSTTSNKTEIGYISGPASYAENRILVDQVEGKNVTVNSNFPFVTSAASNTVSVTNDSNKLYATVPWGEGCMIARLQPQNFVDNGLGDDSNGFTFGLSTVSPDVWKDKDDMTDAEKSYFIRMKQATNPYLIKTPTSLETDTIVTSRNVAGVTATSADFIEWQHDGKKLKCVIYQSDPDATTTVHEEDYVAGTILYPFVLFHGAGNFIKSQKISWTIDPYHKLAEKQTPTIIETSLGTTPPSVIKQASNNILSLHESLADFLGYNNDTNTILQTTNANFIADNIFRATLSNVSFMIELQNIQIDSYNAASGERQNILAVIPQDTSKDNDKIIEYEPNNLYFIDITNTFSIRNIKARILRIDGSTPLISGLSVITLLIK